MLGHRARGVAVGRFDVGQLRAGNPFAQADGGDTAAASGAGGGQQPAVQQQHAVDTPALDELAMFALARGIVGGIRDHQAVAFLMQRVGNAAQDLREKNVRGIGQHRQHGVCAAGAQVPRCEIEHIAGVADRLHDGRARLGAHLVGGGERAADRRGRHARALRNIADRRLVQPLVHEPAALLSNPSEPFEVYPSHWRIDLVNAYGNLGENVIDYNSMGATPPGRMPCRVRAAPPIVSCIASSRLAVMTDPRAAILIPARA